MKTIYFLMLTIAFVRCTDNDTEQAKFVDIERLNAKILKRADFDLSEIMEKTDSVFSMDPNFYIDMIEQMSGGVDKECFERSKIPFEPINKKGLTLNRILEKDSIGRIFLVSFSESIVEASINDHDSINYYRKMWKDGMADFYPARQYMSYFFFHSSLKDLVVRNYLTEKEFNYMVVYLHYLGLITGTVENVNQSSSNTVNQ